MNEFDDRQQKDGSELDHRVLAAARREQPAPELSARMAAALGLSSIAVSGGVHSAAAAESSSPGGTAQSSADSTSRTAERLLETTTSPTASSGSLWANWLPWGAGLLGLAIAGGVLARNTPQANAPQTSAPLTVPAVTSPGAAATPVQLVLEPTNAVVPQSPIDSAIGRAVSPPVVSPTASKPERAFNGRHSTDLSAEIALMDDAREAMSSGAYARAVETLRRYESSHPGGSFRPEATALRIECLVKLGRTSEARSLAERFVARHRGTPLADRVSRVSGLAAP